MKTAFIFNVIPIGFFAKRDLVSFSTITRK